MTETRREDAPILDGKEAKTLRAMRGKVQALYDDLCTRYSGVHSTDEMDGVLLNLYSILKE